jgi:hypothetical protein
LEYLLEDIGNEAGLTKHLSFDMCRWLRCKKRATTSIPTKPVTPVIRIGWYSDGGLDPAATPI